MTIDGKTPLSYKKWGLNLEEEYYFRIGLARASFFLASLSVRNSVYMNIIEFDKLY